MDTVSDSENPNSSPSISLPSEPPDIRNWFPSYQYESFVLDTYDPIGGSAFQESDLEEDRLDVAGNRNWGKDGNLGELGRNSGIDGNHDEHPVSEMPDSTCLQSVLSEPPHIKNWFPSYVYESPVLSSADDFEGSLSTESECQKVLSSNKLVTCTKSFEDTCANMPKSEIPDSFHTPSTLSVSEPPDSGNYFSSYVYKPQEIGIVNQHEREKEKNPWELGPTGTTTKVNTDEKVNSNGSSRVDGSPESLSLNRNFPLEDDVVANRSKVRVSKRKFIHKKDLSEDSENENEVVGNGFVTTKNRPRLKNENSVARPKSGLQKCSNTEGTALPSCGKMATGRRVLSERTNMERVEATGITGKWQCPQKRKPKLGPPLKQLRLERWINKL